MKQIYVRRPRAADPCPPLLLMTDPLSLIIHDGDPDATLPALLDFLLPSRPLLPPQCALIPRGPNSLIEAVTYLTIF